MKNLIGYFKKKTSSKIRKTEEEQLKNSMYFSVESHLHPVKRFSVSKTGVKNPITGKRPAFP